MKIKDLIFLPLENIREWWLDLKNEKERKRILKIREGRIRIKPHTEIEMEEEMKKYLLSSTYIDSDGNEKKTKRLGRTMASYYKEF